MSVWPGPQVTGPIRCFTCLKEVKDFQDLEQHHLTVHGIAAKDAPIPKWPWWRRVYLSLLNAIWVYHWNRRNS